MKKRNEKPIRSRAQNGPNTTVPIRKEAHRSARIACAVKGITMVDFVSAAVTEAAK